MQDTCIYQAPVEVGELWKKKSILHFRNVFRNLLLLLCFRCTKKKKNNNNNDNTFTYKETFIVSY